MHKTAIKRKTISAPMRYLAQRRGAPYAVDYRMNVLHYGEGYAYEDTKFLTRNGADVTAYDPYSENPFTRDASRLEQHYDLGIAIYVLNVLDPLDRVTAIYQLLNCCDQIIIAVRTDKVKGIPIWDGVVTKAGTFQTQRNAKDWESWLSWATTRPVELLHNGGHYAIFEVGG